MATLGLVLAEDEIRQELARLLARLGHEVLQASSLSGALELLQRRSPQVLLVQETLDGSSGEVVLREALRVAPLLPVIVCLNRRDAPRAVELLRLGAFECVAPPWTSESLAVPIRRALRLGTSFELPRPAPPEGRRTGRRLAALGAALAAGLLCLAALKPWLDRRRAEAPLAWALPYAHPAGLAWHAGRLWIGDWYSQSVYAHEPSDLSIVAVHHFPGEQPACLAVAEGSLWVASASGQATKRLLDEQFSLLGRFRLPGAPVGLAYDGLYLWSLDSAQGRLHKHLLDDRLSVLESYPFPGGKPAALAYDGSSLWSLDEGGVLRRHDLASPDRLLASFPPEELGWKPTGLAWDGRRLWSVAESRSPGQGRILRHRPP